MFYAYVSNLNNAVLITICEPVCKTAWECMWKRKEDYKKNKKGSDAQAEQNTHIYQKDKDRKNDIKDFILSRKTEHETKRREWMYLNECAEKEKRETAAMTLVIADTIRIKISDIISIRNVDTWFRTWRLSSKRWRKLWSFAYITMLAIVWQASTTVCPWRKRCLDRHLFSFHILSLLFVLFSNWKRMELLSP
jgi:uncharacterized membrane protein